MTVTKPRSYQRLPASPAQIAAGESRFAGPWVERRIRPACRHGVTRPWSCPRCQVDRQAKGQP